MTETEGERMTRLLRQALDFMAANIDDVLHDITYDEIEETLAMVREMAPLDSDEVILQSGMALKAYSPNEGTGGITDIFVGEWGLHIGAPGLGTAVDDYSTCVLFDHYPAQEGEAPQVLVYGNINDEDATHRISLAGARVDRRED